jgi:hypothetical protein
VKLTTLSRRINRTTALSMKTLLKPIKVNEVAFAPDPIHLQPIYLARMVL